ncbi:MAG: methyltransferase domain-containing protein [Bacteroidota bacterium]
MWPDFSKRSYTKELLDNDSIPAEHLWINLYELDIINRYLGGHRATLRALDKLTWDASRTYTVLDIGCGGGDTLRAVARWATKRGLTIELTGVDLKNDCVHYAKQQCSLHPNIHIHQSDYRDVVNGQSNFDVVITSLFCHHLHNDEVVALLTWCTQHARKATLVNDLHRHWLAYYSIYLLTRLFSNSYLVKNDAPLSVWRGFKRQELEAILQRVSSTTGIIFWSWAFRWIVLIKNNSSV